MPLSPSVTLTPSPSFCDDRSADVLDSLGDSDVVSLVLLDELGDEAASPDPLEQAVRARGRAASAASFFMC